MPNRHAGYKMVSGLSLSLCFFVCVCFVPVLYWLRLPFLLFSRSKDFPDPTWMGVPVPPAAAFEHNKRMVNEKRAASTHTHTNTTEYTTTEHSTGQTTAKCDGEERKDERKKKKRKTVQNNTKRNSDRGGMGSRPPFCFPEWGGKWTT